MAEVTIPQAMQFALELHRAGRLSESEAICRQVLAQQPDFAEAHNQLGQTLMDQGKPAEAEAAFRRAASLREDSAEFHNNLGTALRAQGRADDAVVAFRRAVVLLGDSPEPHHNLGVALLDAARNDEAAAELRRAIELRSDFPDAHFSLGVALERQDRLDEALAEYRRALSLRRDFADAHNAVGNLLSQRRQFDAAIAAYRAALALRPGTPEFHYNLGNALKEVTDFDRAVAAYRQAIAFRPDFPEAYNNLGVALNDAGKLDEAIAAYRQAISLKPVFAEAHNNLGNSLKSSGRPDEAVAAYRQAILLKSDYAEAYNNLGNALTALKRLDEAVAVYHQAIALRPGFGDAYTNLGAALNESGRSDEAIAAYRRAISLKPDGAEAYNNLGNALKDVGQLDEAIAAYRQAIALKPQNPLAHSNWIYTQLFHPDFDGRSIRQAHREWSDRYAVPLARQIRPHDNDRDENRRLRIGYVSAEFRYHVLAFYFVPLLSRHDRRQVEVFCYSNVAAPDEMTRRLRGYADQWRDITGMPDDAAAEMIRRDRIDILVDATLHMAQNRLLVLARKPAPVQATYIGYPGTTGLATIDYRLTDPHLDPPGEHDDFYSEKSIRLPDSFWCYDPLTDEPAINPLPASAPGATGITFGCLNNFCKVNRQVLLLWARVLKQVKNSRMIILANAGSHRDRTLAVLAEEGEGGVEPGRIEFVEKRSRADYLALYHRIDLGLDTFPYNGHTTSLDSLWMGVPVVSLCGQTAVSRAGLCRCANLGLMELVANSQDEFVQIAAALAGDLPRLAELRRTLRRRMQSSPLMNVERFIGNLESAYRQMWKDWCRS